MNIPAGYYRLIASALMLLGVGLFVWSTWDFVNRHYPQLLARQAGAGPAVAVSNQSGSGVPAYSAADIVAAHLFGVADKKTDRDAAQAPETQLRLSLLGVLASPSDRYARALIQVDSRNMRAYAIGDAIEGTDAQLYKVESQRVILDRRGRYESLAMVRQKTKIN